MRNSRLSILKCCMEAVILDTKLDNPYMSSLEMYNSGVSFSRIDADIADTLKNAGGDDEKALTEKFEGLFKEILKKDNLKVKVESLKAYDVSGIIQLSEQSRRMSEMSSIYGMNFGSMPVDETLILNSNNNVIKLLDKIVGDESRKDDAELICRQVYDLAVMSHKPLEMNEMTEFISRSNKILEMTMNM